MNQPNNSLGLMGAPKSRIFSTSGNSRTNDLNQNALKTSDGGMKFKNIGVSMEMFTLKQS